jgi:hypothetical protein
VIQKVFQSKGRQLVLKRYFQTHVVLKESDVSGEIKVSVSIYDGKKLVTTEELVISEKMIW